MQPYSLSSKAPFASDQRYCFIRVAEQNNRFLYANNFDLLLFAIKRQARRLYSKDITRRFLKLGDVSDGEQFGLNFLETVYIVGATHEVLQSWCKHLKFKIVKSGKKTRASKEAGCSI